MYMVLVTPATAGMVYNPMFVSADYKYGGNSLAIGTGEYADVAYAKKTTITVEKTAPEYTHDHNELVTFTINTKIPEFADNYTNPIFVVRDTLSSGLEIFIDADHPFTVSPNEGFSGTPTTGASSFTLTYTAEYLKGLSAATDVTITYTAKVTCAAPYNVNLETNEVTVQYSNNPDSNDDYGLIKDRTNHYTFSLDADIFGQQNYEGSEIVKTGVDAAGNPVYTTVKYNNGTEVGPLEGAHFKLTTDPAGTNVYNNGLVNGADVVSLANGKFNIKGLDEGTYYLTETSAPAGFIKNSSVYKIVITANIRVCF